ncbi:MAG: 50S ribosomal protein L4 [Candidatus Eremiobacteraeota bacterium]|nr:50S ribosomal protein L4 [Candidatus Eremiobacteraeota bacterium]
MPAVIDSRGTHVREAEVPAAFAESPGDKANAMFRAVFRELANPRAGTASTKRRDEVSGGGKKPWRQKGTGRARQGSTRSPQWRHGGVVFGPTPRSYEVSLNKKERKTAMRAALGERFRADAVTVLETEGLSIEKTRDVATMLFGSSSGAKRGARTLLVYGRDEHLPVGERLLRLGRNLPRVAITHTGALDVKDVLGYPRLVLTTAALTQLADDFAPSEEAVR